TQNYTNPYKYLNTAPNVLLFPQDGCPGTPPTNPLKIWNLNLGRWEQHEMWYKSNTCTGGNPNSDGFFRFYINGSVFVDFENTQWGNDTAHTSPPGPGPCWSGVPFQVRTGGNWTYQYST